MARSNSVVSAVVASKKETSGKSGKKSKMSKALMLAHQARLNMTPALRYRRRVQKVKDVQQRKNVPIPRATFEAFMRATLNEVASGTRLTPLAVETARWVIAGLVQRGFQACRAEMEAANDRNRLGIDVVQRNFKIDGEHGAKLRLKAEEAAKMQVAKATHGSKADVPAN